MRLALLLVIAAVVGGCSGNGVGTPAAGTASPAQGPTAAVTSPVDGVPIHIDAEGFTKVTGFTLRTDDGRQLEFAMGALENGDQFPPNHLAEHLAGSTTVRVFFRDEGGKRVAYRIEDVLAP